MLKSLALSVALLTVFVAGFLCGHVMPPVDAQETIYGYDNRGNSWSSFQSIPGAPTYYYGSDGTSGSYYNTTPTPPSSRNPC